MAELRGRYTHARSSPTTWSRRAGSRDECMFMLLGELVETAPTTELFTTPKDERTARYIEGRYG